MLSMEGVFFVLAFLFFYYSLRLASFLKGSISHIFTAAGSFLFIIAAIFGVVDVFVFGLEYYISIVGFYGFFVWVIALSFILAGWFCFVMTVRKVYGKFLKPVLKFPHGKYYLIGLMLLTVLGTPIYIADVAIKGFDWISVATISVWILAFASLTIDERGLYHATRRALKVKRVKKGGLVLMRDDIRMIMANTDMVNRFLEIMRPSIGVSSIMDTFTKCTEDYPILSKGCKITKKGLLNTKPVLKNLDRIEERERMHRIVDMFSDLNSRLIKLYSAVTSSGYAKKMVEENYKAVSEQYKSLSIFPQILKGMPEGILEEEKLSLLSKEELEKRVKKRTKELERIVKELKELDIWKDKFIAMLSHELKTPLTHIHGFSQLLQNKDIAGNIKLRNKYLKIIDNETKRFGKLITNILDLSRIDLGTFRFDFRKVKLSDVINDVRRIMEASIKKKGLVSIYETAEDLPLITTDGGRLTQILLNLLTNAVNFTPKGKITVRVEREGKNIHFSIADTGIGIAKKELENIFERFYQIESPYTRKVSGSGLGLSLCKEFIGGMGGKIWAESELGKGSIFHFTLPVKGKKLDQKRKFNKG